MPGGQSVGLVLPLQNCPAGQGRQEIDEDKPDDREYFPGGQGFCEYEEVWVGQKYPTGHVSGVMVPGFGQ